MAETNGGNDSGTELTEDSAAATLRLAVVANERVMVNKKTNEGYIREFKRYKNWLQSQPNDRLRRNPVVSVQNIEVYFSTEVAHRKGKASTTNRWVAAIQHYVDISPKGPHLPEGFSLRANRAVKLALEAQQVRNNLTGGTANPGSDPHKGLKDNLREGDRDKIMTYIYKNVAEWGAACISFSWGLNGALRGASNRSLNYSDINMSYGFAPTCANIERTDGNRAALIVILRHGERHKDRHDLDQQVAVWRHKRYKECSVFATAAHLVWSLSQDNDIHFRHPNRRSRAPWWDVPLIRWDDYSGKHKIVCDRGSHATTGSMLVLFCLHRRHVETGFAHFEWSRCRKFQSYTPPNASTPVRWFRGVSTLANQHNNKPHHRKAVEELPVCCRETNLHCDGRFCFEFRISLHTRENTAAVHNSAT